MKGKKYYYKNKKLIRCKFINKIYIMGKQK